MSIPKTKCFISKIGKQLLNIFIDLKIIPCEKENAEQKQKS